MRTPRKERPLRLALPGGGTHGAFGWGVIDALLEDGRFDLEAVSAVGSGAINGALLASAWPRGRDAGRAALTRFWRAVAFESPGVPVFPPSQLDDARFAQVLAPFDKLAAHPLDALRALLEKHIDFHALNQGQVRFSTCAMDVSSGRFTLFGTDLVALHPLHLLASACTPFACEPILVDGRPFWGDGLGGDPPLYPLLPRSGQCDILLLAPSQVRARALPNTAPEIFERFRDLAMWAAQVADLHYFRFLRELIDEGRGGPGRARSVRLHRIDGATAILALTGNSSASRARSDPDYLQALFLLGRQEASAWLEDHAGLVGRRSTVDESMI